MSGSTQPTEDVCKRIRDKHPEVDPVEFHEFVKNALTQAYAEGPGGPTALPQVVEFLIEGEEDHFFDKHVSAFMEKKQRRGEIAATIKIKNLVPIKPKAQEAKEIDRAVRAGGLTLVHVKVEERDLNGLRRLHEEKGAKLDVGDNSGQKPIDLARSLGYVEIVSYIESRLTGATSR